MGGNSVGRIPAAIEGRELANTPARHLGSVPNIVVAAVRTTLGDMEASDSLDIGAQPHCPDCRVVMRPVDGGDACPECGFFERHLAASRPEDFDGPSVSGW